MNRLIAVFILGLLMVSGAYAQDQKQDELAIRAAIDTVNKAWTTVDGAAVMASIMSDSNFFVIVHNQTDESQTRIFDKKGFVTVFSNMLKNNMPRKHVHTIGSITFYGPVCYEIGKLVDISKAGVESVQETLNIFIRYPEGWKLQMTVQLNEVVRALDAPRIW